MNELNKVKNEFYKGDFFVDSPNSNFDIKEEMKNKIKTAISKDTGFTNSQSSSIFEKAWNNGENMSMLDVFLDIEELISLAKKFQK